MNEIRLFVASIAFITGIYLVYDLISNSFSIYVLGGAVLSFIVAHFLLPRRAKQSGTDPIGAFDLLEIIIDFPYNITALFLRSIGRIFGSKDGGIDIDL